MVEDHDRIILAASGYLELGMYKHVWAELHQLPIETLDRIDVLEILILSLIGEERWEEAIQNSKRYRSLAPLMSAGYIHEAYCLHATGQTQQALDILLQGPSSLRDSPLFYYNAGCYYARVGKSKHALKMLQKAFEMNEEFRQSAQTDPDLDSVRDQL